jgi:hypothetical protein
MIRIARITALHVTSILLPILLPSCSRTFLPDTLEVDQSPDQDASSLSGATLDADVVDDAGIDINTACVVPGNIFVIVRQSRPPYPPIIESGSNWSVVVHDYVHGLPASLSILTADMQWSAEFSTASLGKPLLPGIYVSGADARFPQPNQAGMDIAGSGNDYGSIGGFQVLEMDARPWDGSVTSDPYVTSFTATFKVASFADLIGCVHIVNGGK